MAPRDKKIPWYDKKKAKHSQQTVIEIAVAARKVGMTYGKYVEMMEIKKSAAGGNQDSGQKK